tara:strand:- start:3076 stop:3357 length:282 start_codon:yes stop_codon:yes gene_type:complete
MNDWVGIGKCKTEKTAIINVCGGCADWWNYVLVFDKNKNYTLYKEDRLGRHILPSKLIYHIDEEEVKEIFDLNEYLVQKDEIIVDYNFFYWDE